MNSAEGRIRGYIRGLEEALSSIEILKEDVKVHEVLENVKAYLDDARYYLEKGDLFTSLTCVAYGEGLLDCLRALGYVSYEWPKYRLKRPKVLVAGTFDILHPGHIYILRKAWELGRVYVVIARDVNVERFKGRKPIIPERQRLELIRNIKWVHEAVLGDKSDIIRSVELLQPDIILLGPDQPIKEEELHRELVKRGLNPKIIKLEERSQEYPLSSTQKIINRIIHEYKEHASI